MGLDVDFYRVKKENIVNDYSFDSDDYCSVLYFRKPYELCDWFLELPNKRGFMVKGEHKNVLPIRIYKSDYEEFMKELRSGNIYNDRGSIKYYSEQMETLREYFYDDEYVIYFIASW